MGLLDGKIHVDYYNGNDLGNYQFTSLEMIIAQFEIAYVGEGKIIPKVKKQDIAFHAMRALQELSFDTFKSVKAQQIDVPASLTMPLPHDYVNYTKISTVDSSGIKHPLYPIKDTSNPFQILQEDDGRYSFPEDADEVINGTTFKDTGYTFLQSWHRTQKATASGTVVAGYGNANDRLNFFHGTRTSHNATNWGHAMAVWQELDVSDKDFIDVIATGQAVNLTGGVGVLRLGVSTMEPDENSKNPDNPNSTAIQTTNTSIDVFNLTDYQGNPSYLEWASADGEVEKESSKIDVTSIDTIYVIIISYHNFTASQSLTTSNHIEQVKVRNAYTSKNLSTPEGNEKDSSTWQNYKSTTPSEVNNDNYEDDVYWPLDGQRYGLNPSHAQINGSFYIDQRIGRIHFSSDVSGKTIILDYISDSLGTDAEMQVHKFAEDAMYKWIAHAIISTSSYGQALVPRFTKEKFAAIRKAKLRLSNIKLEELTQILRGKSKQIKH